MLDIRNATDGAFATSLKPWINVLAGVAARLWLSLAMFAGLSGPMAHAQTQMPFATGVTAPGGGLILSGTAINPRTGNPYRHLWSSDQGGFGLCRVDPDVETPGPHAVNADTCMPFIGATQFKPGQLAFDPATNNIYTVDIQANSDLVVRLHYVPGGDNGLGTLDPGHVEVLAANGVPAHGVTLGCPLPGRTPNSASLGPDGNLYIGFKQSGNLVRITAPQTQPLPACSNIQVIGTTADQFKDFGLGWIGHDLYGTDSLSLWIIANAEQCLTPVNGLLPCRGIPVLQAQTAAPTFVMSDQVYPNTNGMNLFVGNGTSVTLLNTITFTATQNYASGFEVVSGMALDPTNMGLYVADDRTLGLMPVQGHWFDVGNGPENGGRPPGTLTEFATGVTSPIGGVVLTGSGVNPATGKPYRHLWTSDLSGFGLCRIDPDVDSPSPHAINPNTCLSFVAGVPFLPGQLAFDPLLDNLYAVDLQANTQGVFRLHFLPDGNGGHGAIDPLHTEVLGGNPSAAHQVLPAACGIPGNIPNSAVLGPDGNLYIGFKQSGNILRVVSPQTEPLPCDNVQVIGTSPDNKKNFGLGWVGHDLYGGDGLAAWIMVGADKCLTSFDGNQPCPTMNILVGQTANPTYVMTDQLYPSLNGRNLFVGKPGSITLVDTINLKVTQDYATGFQSLTGMALDPANFFLYAADDPSDAKAKGLGHWWLVGQQQQVTPLAPGTPTNVLALAGNAQVALDWTAAPDGVPVTSFTVHNSFASNNAPIPDIVIDSPDGTSAPPTTAIITGLTDGVSYQFAVAANNAAGSSPYSTPSNAVTPQMLIVPGEPTNVSAAPGDALASIAWSSPAVNGGSAITSYTVTVLSAGVPTGVSVTVQAPATGVVIKGLNNGTTYAFTVHATNTTGNSPESAPSNAATPKAPGAPAIADLLVTISGANAVPFNSMVVYEITITNNGNTTVPQVMLADAFASSVASFVSAVPSQGTCVQSFGAACNFGSLTAGSTITVAVTENLIATATNAASVRALDNNGLAMTLANPANGTASITTTVSAPPPPPPVPSPTPNPTPVPAPTPAPPPAPTPVPNPTPAPTPNPTPVPSPTPTPVPSPSPTPVPSPTPAPTPANQRTITDLGLLGGFIASPGGGTVTWQVINLGAADANGVVLVEHLPLGITVQSTATSPVGFCSQSPAFDNSIRLACGLSTLPHGQTWTVTVNVAMTVTNPETAARVTFTGTDTDLANNHSLISMNNNPGNKVQSVGTNTEVSPALNLVFQLLPGDPVSTPAPTGAVPASPGSTNLTSINPAPADSLPLDTAPAGPAAADPNPGVAQPVEAKATETKIVEPKIVQPKLVKSTPADNAQPREK